MSAATSSGGTPESPWVQQQLFPGNPVELELRAGFVGHQQRTMWQLTITDPTTSTLVGMMSWPAVHDDDLPVKLTEIVGEMVRWARAITEPFPS